MTDIIDLLEKIFYRIPHRFQSKIYERYYSNYNVSFGLNTEKRKHHIVVSLTSYPPRFSKIGLCLKTLLNQTMKPDVLLLILSEQEIISNDNIPYYIKELEQFGLSIIVMKENLKLHNKYYYAMKTYPDSLIITVDDDMFYPKDLIKSLYKTYLQFPDAVSARFICKILLDSEINIASYNQWPSYHKELQPSLFLFALGIGGVLYPPHILPDETLDNEKIKKFCLMNDDIWLKYMELKNKIPVIWTKCKRPHPVTIENTQEVARWHINVTENQNDELIKTMENNFDNILSRTLSNTV